MKRHPLFRNRSGAIAITLVLTTSVSLAQSSSISTSSIDYSFSLDPNSTPYGSNLQVSDNGLVSYNLITSGYNNGPYTAMTGSGVATAGVDPSTSYNGTTWTGHNQISSSASNGPIGTASASAGSQETIYFTNTGTNSISIDVSALSHVTGSVSLTGPTSTTNFAQATTYAGIYDYDITTSSAISNPTVKLNGDASTGVNATLTGDWTPKPSSGQGYYTDNYVLTLAPGERHLLEFYASAENLTSSGAATPEPAGFIPIVVGLVGIAAFRKKSRLAMGREVAIG